MVWLLTGKHEARTCDLETWCNAFQRQLLNLETFRRKFLKYDNSDPWWAWSNGLRPFVRTSQDGHGRVLWNEAIKIFSYLKCIGPFCGGSVWNACKEIGAKFVFSPLGVGLISYRIIVLKILLLYMVNLINLTISQKIRAFCYHQEGPEGVSKVRGVKTFNLWKNRNFSV